jgi:hypothetical protein
MTKRQNPPDSDSQDVLGSAEHNTEGIDQRRQGRTPNAAVNYSKRTAGEDVDIFFCVCELHKGQVDNDGAIKLMTLNRTMAYIAGLILHWRCHR